jgi:hypothetical protein
MYLILNIGGPRGSLHVGRHVEYMSTEVVQDN